MRRVATKALHSALIALTLCAACRADGLDKKSKEDIRELLKNNNDALVSALDKSIKTNNATLSKNISDAITSSNVALGKTLSAAIEKLRPTSASDSTTTPVTVAVPPSILIPSAPIQKTVRHVYIHKYVHCCRIYWDDDPCWWRW
jgi:hypothetical protein